MFWHCVVRLRRRFLSSGQQDNWNMKSTSKLRNTQQNAWLNTLLDSRWHRMWQTPLLKTQVLLLLARGLDRSDLKLSALLNDTALHRELNSQLYDCEPQLDTLFNNIPTLSTCLFPISHIFLSTVHSRLYMASLMDIIE